MRDLSMAISSSHATKPGVDVWKLFHPTDRNPWQTRELAGPARRVARRLATGGRLSIISGDLTKLGSQDRVSPRGAVGDVVERRRIGVRLAVPGAEFVR